MGRNLMNVGEQVTLGYDRAAVEDFLRAAAEEREKLQQQIDSSNMRLARARTALGTHRVMVAMLLETQRELSAMRRDAELQAAEILANAEREARSREHADDRDPAAESIDLRAGSSLSATAPGNPNADPAWVMSPSPHHVEESVAANDRGEDSEFFEFLRGALHDDEPLGPRSE